MSVYSASELDHLNFEYSPSQHTKRYKSAEDAIQGHIKITEAETNRVQHDCGFLIDYDVTYGADEDEKVDVYYKETTAKDAPLFIYIHGGYWQILTKDSCAYCVAPLVNAGYRVLIANYSLCPKVSLSDLVQQIRKCMKFCINYGAERSSLSISFGGHSAGAHLIMSALSDVHYWKSLENKALLKHCYLISGIYDLSIIRYLSEINKNNILGINDENVTEVSPFLHNFAHLKDVDTKFHVFVGEHDSKTFQQHSNDICKHLTKDTDSNDRASCEILADYDHFGIVEDLRLDDFLITKRIIGNKNV